MEKQTKGKYAGTIRYSPEDDERLSKHKWHITKRGYVVATIEKKTVQIHQFLTDFPGAAVDHVNGIKTDNRRENLRVATPQQNAANKRKRMTDTTTSQYTIVIQVMAHIIDLAPNI